MQPKKEYPYVIIDTEEKRKVFGPKLPTDEFWDVNIWLSIAPLIGGGFSDKVVYRRRISPGEGFEIVPANDRTTIPDQFTCDGIRWERYNNIWNGTEVQFICTHNASVLAFRRRKQSLPTPVEPSPWRLISTSDLTSVHDDGRVLLGFVDDKGETHTLSVGSSDFKIGNVPKRFTHWQPISPVPKPVKPMTEEEALKALMGDSVDPYGIVCRHKGWLAHKAFVERGGK